MKVKSLSHVQLLTTPWTAAHQAPPSMGFPRQEYWSGVPFLDSCKNSCKNIQQTFCSVAAAAAKSLQSCSTLCDPIDGSPPGSSVPGILQARILEWVAISFSNACMHANSLQSCPTLCDRMDSSPPRLLCPQDSPGKNTGVGCHFLLHSAH